MIVATCDPREQLHKFVHGHFFLFVSESGLGDAVSPPLRNMDTVSEGQDDISKGIPNIR